MPHCECGQEIDEATEVCPACHVNIMESRVRRWLTAVKTPGKSWREDCIQLRELCGRLAEALVEFSENDQYTEATGDLVDEGRAAAAAQ